MCGHQAACFQVSAVLFYAQTARKFVRAQICVGDTRVSRLQVKGRQHYLRQNRSDDYRVCRTCSTGPDNAGQQVHTASGSSLIIFLFHCQRQKRWWGKITQTQCGSILKHCGSNSTPTSGTYTFTCRRPSPGMQC